MNKCIVVLQARMGSTRFPGKVLASFIDGPMLETQVKLLNKFGFKIILATSNKSIDKAIEDFCVNHGLSFFRGSESDVFSRYAEIAKANPGTDLIRLTADNPIVSEVILKEVLARHRKTQATFTSTRMIENERVIRFIPKGYSVDVIRSDAFAKVDPSILTDFDKEHVIPIFYRLPIKTCIVKTFEGLSLEDLSIDYPEDMDRVKKLIQTAGGISSFIQKTNSALLERLG